eukprot:CAMPEP_0170523356 /NCGR_PEP_ID=MMETSP0209-20121228/8788_1 /TAXON_ID=665100 ORGANISM="Litonotus pictus, Strain P1" /NCGR_SAMPLE_ID=MMETSP0209 /ASSEMBLY_ACC=CAM_ASM_000301 /LENGTH=431 /DNA_ID=CAMNT_0010811413 /DNA_START=35 /DNA_END=1330 /DNA_ORIENTATION=+
MSLYRTYLKEEWKENIINYKFKSKDNSLVYKYFTSPMCDALIEKIPTWIAPNVITLAGFSLVILLFVMVMSFGGRDGMGDIPGFVSFSAGWLYYAYHILDNLDGKQARRTKNSTPLGMLVDHGCDSVTAVLISIVMATIMKLTYNPYYIFVVVSLTTVPFYLCTWEEFHTGTLELPLFNAVNEGTILLSSIMIFTGIFGQGMWEYQISLGFAKFQFNQLALFSSLAMSITFGVISVIGVINFQKEQEKQRIERANEINDSNFIDPNVSNPSVNYFKILNSTILCIILHTSYFLVVTFSSEQSIAYTTPWIVALTYGFMFAKLLVHLMMALISSSEFEQWRMSIINCSIVLPIVALFTNIKPEYITEFNTVFYIFCAKNFCLWLNNCIKLSTELCGLLKIRFFFIKEVESTTVLIEEKYSKVENYDVGGTNN